MGGHALQVESVRLPAARYKQVETSVIAAIRHGFPTLRAEPVLSYADKTDFGDLDVLVESGEGFNPTALAEALEATEVVRNGDVTSVGIQLPEGVFQVDLIKIHPHSFDFASRYFGLGDFGNLVGRVAHKFGAKFGHAGMLYPIRDAVNDNQVIAEVPITKNFSAALALCGYDAEHYESMRAGGQFRTLEDVFRYVMSSPYANREIYLLDNRNHAGRTRDSKRVAYNAFLSWLEMQSMDSLHAYPWAESGSRERFRQKADFLETAFSQHPDFKEAYDTALESHDRKKRVKQFFNGNLAGEVTGLSGKQLGQLMAEVRNSFSNEETFEAFFLNACREDAEALFLATKNKI